VDSASQIRDISVTLLKAPLNQPFRIATGQHDSLHNVLLTIHLQGGIKGFGEAAIASHITGETVLQTVRNLNAFGKVLRRHQVSDYLIISGLAHAAMPDNKAGVAAVEIAVLDALTRYLNMPLWRLWAHKPRLLKTDITIVIADLPETIMKTKEFYQQGFRAFKVKVGRDMDMDLKRVIAVASIIRRSQLIIDANQGFCVKQALVFLKQLDKAGVKVDLLEQPVLKADWEGLREVARKSKVCVCADESASSLPQVMRLIKEKSVGAVNIKLMKTGVVHAVAIARWAQANGVKLMIGGMMESNLAMTASAHLAAGIGGFDFIDLDTPFFIRGAVKQNPYLSGDGTYDLRGVKAGIGIHP
jgi:L-alanine-DL-glutamate epimerase and related enzymes of enolase superfamily